MIAELQSISKSYEQQESGKSNLVLDKVSLSVSENDSIAIVGPSGSGKSTLLNILGTLDQPSSGKVFLDGTRTDEMDQDDLALVRSRYIGFIFQLHHLLPQLTLLENVLLPVLPFKDHNYRVSAGSHAIQLIERLGLKDLVNQRPGQLSVGESQRAAVVRALVNHPRLLLADEPTGSLDAGNAENLGQMLAELNHEQNVAVIVVTHSMDLATKMKKIYRLNAGKLIEINV
jgi:lipoprotein-releasing system ATP-binding protein